MLDCRPSKMTNWNTGVIKAPLDVDHVVVTMIEPQADYSIAFLAQILVYEQLSQLDVGCMRGRK